MNNWKKSSKKNDVEVYTYNIEGNYTGFMGISELQYSAEDIMHVLNKPEIPFSCNPFGEKNGDTWANWSRNIRYLYEIQRHDASKWERFCNIMQKDINWGCK